MWLVKLRKRKQILEIGKFKYRERERGRERSFDNLITFPRHRIHQVGPILKEQAALGLCKMHDIGWVNNEF